MHGMRDLLIRASYMISGIGGVALFAASALGYVYDWLIFPAVIMLTWGLPHIMIEWDVAKPFSRSK